MYQKVLQKNVCRAGIVMLVAIVLFPYASIALAQGDTFVWGRRFRSGSYHAVDVYMKFPNTSIPFGTWVAGPNAVSNRVDTFIESGPWKDCRTGKDCALRPYGTWQSASGGGGTFRDTSLLLADNGQYRYYSTYIGNNQWQSVFCSGSGCRGMITGSLGVDRLPYVISGGESLGGARWGSATTRFAKYRPYNSSTVYSWCWDSTFVSPSNAGTVSVCNRVDYSWTSNRS